jgi:hypothetical protein
MRVFSSAAIFVRLDLAAMSTTLPAMPPVIHNQRPAKKFEPVDPYLLDHMFDTDAPALLTRVTEAARAEARAAAARLVAIGELFRLRLAQHGKREEWAADTCAENTP